MIWYNMMDNGTNPVFFDHNLGLVRRDFGTKPDYEACQT